MNKNRFTKRVAATAGLLLLCGAPGLTCARSTPPGPMQTLPTASPARPKRDTGPADDFAGLKFTDDQKTKIDQIHQNMKSRMDAAAKDEKLSADQKGAMLEGFRRMERNEVFKVLTPEQQLEVRRRVRARRAAEQEEKRKQPRPE